jgi:membrane-associated phospholipid phosphatase
MSFMTPIDAPIARASQAVDAAPRHRACLLGWIVVGAAVPVAAGIVLASGMQLVIASFLPLVFTAALLGIVHHIYARVRPEPRLALTASLLALLVLAGLLAGVISHAGLRMHYPLIDAWLDGADRAMGINTPRLALMLALHPHWGTLLNLIYVSAFPAVFLTALWLGLRGQDARAWELGLGFTGGILIAATIAAFFPALGNMAYHQLDGTKGLPAGAGSYYLEAFHYFRDGHDPRFDMRQLSGVVEFPSFHMIMALIVPYALRRTGVLGWAAIAWSVLVVVSTIAIGGHYVIDLVGGAVLWAACMWAARDGRAAPRA